MANIDDLITTYLTACAVEGKSPNTIHSYRASLADFRRVGAKLGLPDEIGGYAVPDVYAFLHDLQARPATPAYQHRRHREVKAFFSWCGRMDLVAGNVFARVPLVKLEQQIIQPFNRSDITTLLQVPSGRRQPGTVGPSRPLPGRLRLLHRPLQRPQRAGVARRLRHRQQPLRRDPAGGAAEALLDQPGNGLRLEWPRWLAADLAAPLSLDHPFHGLVGRPAEDGRATERPYLPVGIDDVHLFPRRLHRRLLLV